jgi:hypothetical protein
VGKDMFRKKLTVKDQLEKLKLLGLEEKQSKHKDLKKRSQADKIAALKELIEQDLEDSISMESISDAVITPGGITYDRKQINDWLTQNETDPSSRNPLKSKDLLPNGSVNGVIIAFQTATDLADLKHQLNECLSCPLSKLRLRFTDPVVAQNGFTYERKEITAYLEANSIIPGFTIEDVLQVDCSKLIDNLLIKTIIEKLDAELDNNLDDIEENIDETPNDLDTQLSKHISALFDFASGRQEKNKLGDVLALGYNKHDKGNAAQKLISVLTGQISIDDAIDQKTLAVLLNGDLGKIAKPALQFFLTYEKEIGEYIASQEVAKEEEKGKEEKVGLGL